MLEAVLCSAQNFLHFAVNKHFFSSWGVCWGLGFVFNVHNISEERSDEWVGFYSVSK